MESITYRIPSNIIDLFAEESLKNVGQNGKHLETLALLIGKRDQNVITTDEIIFPSQTGYDSNVNDDGKFSIQIVKTYQSLILY